MLVLCSRRKFHIQLLRLCVPAFIIICIVWQNLRVYSTPSAYNAYVFYAHSDNYACSVLVNAHILQHLMGTRYRIFAIISDGISRTMQDALAAKNISLIKETPLPLHANSIPYYEGCLLKLAAFRMHEYDSSIQRLLVLDADQLILRNLDMIFDTQMTDFMAPTAYWISNDTITSTCMLIQPGKPMWDRVKAAAKRIKSDKYDMDLINDLFAERGDRLSERYVTLNSHWEDWNIPLWMGPRSSNGTAIDQQLRALYDQAAIIHFTAAGKPWMHDTQALREQKPDARPLMVEQWARWRSLALHNCPAGILDLV
ncbi:alphaN-acetylglucosamine transferase, partial [Metarhizium majus ARSEF 297]